MLLIDGKSEILVIRVSPLHLLLSPETKVTLDSTPQIYKTIELLTGCQRQSDCLLPHTPPTKQFSLFPSGCRLPGACRLPLSHPPSALLFIPDFMHAAASHHLQGECHTPLEVLGHFSNTALHFNYHLLASKLCILVSGTCPLKPPRSPLVPLL